MILSRLPWPREINSRQTNEEDDDRDIETHAALKDNSYKHND